MVKVLSRYKGMARMAMNIWSIRNQSGDIVPVILSATADGNKIPRFNIELSINRNIPQSQYQYSCGVAWRELAIGNWESRADREMRSTLYVCSSSHNFSFFSTCENFFNHFLPTTKSFS